MRPLRATWARARNLFRNQKLERQIEDELAAHVDLHISDNLRSGMSPAEARRSALLKLGGIEQTKENYRETAGFPTVESVAQDLRFALRMLRKSPGLATAAILTLALGIGANTAIFTVFYGVLLRPLPFPKPEQMVQLHEVNDRGGQPNFSDPNFEDVQAKNHSLQAIAEYNLGPEVISVGDVSFRPITSAVSRDFPRVMGVQPMLGRGFSPEEQHFNAAPVAIVSYSFWKQILGGSQDLSSFHLKIGGRPAAVVGIMPPGFRFPGNADLWVPREIYERYPSRTAHNWQVIARLADGIDIARARPDLSTIARSLKQQYGQDTSMTDVAIESLHSAMTGNVRLGLVVLLIASVFFLLIACSNVVNLMLAQAAARQQELSIRAALGAGAGRLLRQFVTESLVLSLIGGAFGVAAAFWGLTGLLRLAPATLPRLEEVSINVPVLLFSFGIVVLIAVAVGMGCAWKSLSVSPENALNEGSRLQGAAPHRQMALRVMIAVQLVTVMVLLVGAGLMGRSLVRVLSVDPGFTVGNALTMELDLPNDVNPARRVQLLNELFTRLRSLPGVEQVGGGRLLPLFSGSRADGSFVVMNPGQISPRMRDLIQRSLEGSLDSDPVLLKEFSDFFEELFRDREHMGDADYRVVSQGYFETLRIPVLKGRLFEDRDTPDSQSVAVISESLAQQEWPDHDPLGQTIEFGNMDGDPRLLMVVGVVGDVRESSLEAAPRPVIYVDYRQRPQTVSEFSFVIRNSGVPGPVFSAAREIVRDLDPRLVPRFNSLAHIYSGSLDARRFSLTLVAIFSAAALLLAMAGIYGVNAYSVAQRTGEIGVRTALGASASQIMRMILKQAVFTALAAIIIGILASAALTRLIQSLLFEVSPVDPVTFSAVTIFLLFAVVLASWLPARRATRIDPMIALRYQ